MPQPSGSLPAIGERCSLILSSIFVARWQPNPRMIRPSWQTAELSEPWCGRHVRPCARSERLGRRRGRADTSLRGDRPAHDLGEPYSAACRGRSEDLNCGGETAVCRRRRERYGKLTRKVICGPTTGRESFRRAARRSGRRRWRMDRPRDRRRGLGDRLAVTVRRAGLQRKRGRRCGEPLDRAKVKRSGGTASGSSDAWIPRRVLNAITARGEVRRRPTREAVVGRRKGSPSSARIAR